MALTKPEGAVMTNPFASSHSKIARAKEHFAELEKRVKAFVDLNPCKEITEDDPSRPGFKVFKVKLTEPLPEAVGNILGDLVGNLRSALDTTAYAIAVASGKTNPKNTAFPFAGSVSQMANALGRAKDLPKEIHSLFCGFQPYLGGDDLLWLLNEICVSDKHKIVTPLVAGILPILRRDVSATEGFLSAPQAPTWDSAKNEMEVLTFGPGTQFQYHFQFHLFVAFQNVPLVSEKPILPILDNLFGKIERILTAMEWESRRLGIVK